MPTLKGIARTAALFVATLSVVASLEACGAESRFPGTALAFRLDASAGLRDIIKALPAPDETSPNFGFDPEEWLEVSRRRQLYRAEVDLDGDGVAELLVLAEQSAFCGTAGCETILLKKESSGWRLVETFKVHRSAFILLPETDLGWRRFFNGEEVYLRTECGYTTQDVIDEEASRGHGPCDAH